MWKILTAASTALVLIGTPALAQWEEYDANQDALVDENEFGAGFGAGGVFGGWDEDDDELLSQDEWGAGMFGAYDRDGDAAWNQEEFGAFGERRFGGYRDWDEDADGFLSEDEFNAGVYRGYEADDVEGWNQEEFGAYEEDGWF